MLQKSLWLLGAVGAVCLAINAGRAQDRIESPVDAQVQTPQAEADQERGVTLIPGNRPVSPGSEAAGTGTQEIRPYRRGTKTGARSPDAFRPLRSGDSRENRAEASQLRPVEPGIRNYHQELFGTAPSPRSESLKTAAPRSAAEVRQAGFTAAPQPQNPELVNNAVPVSKAAGKSADPAGNGLRPVISADYATTLHREPVVPVSHREPSAPASQKSVLPGQKPDSGEAVPLHTETLPLALNARSAVQSEQAPAAGRLVTNFTKQSPQIDIEWRRKGDMNVGHECRLELLVRNTGQATAFNVEVNAAFPDTVRLTDAAPRPVAGTDSMVWRFPSLEAGEERQLDVTVIPLESGEVPANANVRFTSAATSVFQVEEPLLTLAVSGPEQVSQGEPATHVVTIANPGTGAARNVRVIVSLPAGLEHVSRRDRLMMELGSLSPGEKRDIRLSLTAIAGGEQSVVVNAASGSGLQQESKSVVSVLAPKMNLTVTGPGLRYVGRDARYTLRVANSGAATTNNVRAMYAVPAGFEFQSASRGGKFDHSTRIVSWFVGSVQPDKSIDLSVRLRPVKLGEFAHAARIVSERGDVVEAETQTRIEGTASLVLKVDDLDDPVETGRETAYEITVRNDGSKAAQTVGLSIELPVGVKLIDVKGPSSHIAESGLVVFKSMPVLPAGRTATYRISVQGMEEGHQRLRARLTSDSIQEPLTVEELTRFYAD
ncbi:MAG: hypothetical protein VB858_10550 [Planctomycetaceae bacterium]